MLATGARKVRLPTGVLPERREIFTAAIWASVAALLAMDFLACLSPEWFYDGQIYHLGLPERFLLAHRFAVQPGNMLTFLPLNAEMVYLPALAWGGEEAAKLINWTWGALLPLAVYALACGIAPGRDSWRAGAVAALVFVSMPVTLVENEITFSDNLRTLFETLALVWILRARPGRTAAFVLAGAFAGLAMGTKYLSVVRALLLLGGAAWLAGILGRNRPRPGRPAAPASPVKPVILYAAVAFAAVLPWLARNTFAGRDPVYPFGVGLFASVGYSPEELSRWMADNRHYGVAGLTVKRWLSIPWRVAIRPDTDDFGTFATGPLPVALAVFVLARRVWPPAAIFAAAVLGVEAFVWSMTSHLIRYLLPALAVMSALLGVSVAEAGTLSRRYARIMTGILFAWAACSFGIRAMNRFMVDDQYGIYGYTLGRFDKDTALSGRGYGADFGKLPREGRVLLVGEDRVLGMGRLWTGGSEYNIQAVKAWARESPDSRRFAIKARQAGIGAVVLNVPRFKDSLARGPAFDLSPRELAIVNPWWKGLREAYKNPPRIGYAVTRPERAPYQCETHDTGRVERAR
jgi:4-amino-4-deoxy-L-arabinose transferase-like glycosyltransferase